MSNRGKDFAGLERNFLKYQKTLADHGISLRSKQGSIPKEMLKTFKAARNRLRLLSRQSKKYRELRESYKIEAFGTERRTKEKRFYVSKAWRELRIAVIVINRKQYGKPTCVLCNATSCEMHVDHIKPRSKYPELELDLDNLQLLCKECNLGKSDHYEEDWRPVSNILPFTGSTLE